MSADENEPSSLLQVLTRIHQDTPGAKLEHLEVWEENRPEPWEEGERKILTVEHWMRIVLADFRNAPSSEARETISGPYYKWHRDEWGRAIVEANHRGEFVPMFEEVWAGDPLS